ncbi:unnamed protein product [Polarella glacialis]|uniref:Uncharacterized protein n=1 Tax=Polarella glacialis TaxID=89957 RepID=A0A813JTU9_POLGL|nr:unnamed protein product [Polarella glacialis]
MMSPLVHLGMFVGRNVDREGQLGERLHLMMAAAQELQQVAEARAVDAAEEFDTSQNLHWCTGSSAMWDSSSNDPCSPIVNALTYFQAEVLDWLTKQPAELFRRFSKMQFAVAPNISRAGELSALLHRAAHVCTSGEVPREPDVSLAQQHSDQKHVREIGAGEMR